MSPLDRGMPSTRHRGSCGVADASIAWCDARLRCARRRHASGVRRLACSVVHRLRHTRSVAQSAADSTSIARLASRVLFCQSQSVGNRVQNFRASRSYPPSDIATHAAAWSQAIDAASSLRTQPLARTRCHTLPSHAAACSRVMPHAPAGGRGRALLIAVRRPLLMCDGACRAVARWSLRPLASWRRCREPCCAGRALAATRAIADVIRPSLSPRL